MITIIGFIIHPQLCLFSVLNDQAMGIGGNLIQLNVFPVLKKMMMGERTNHRLEIIRIGGGFRVPGTRKGRLR